MLALLTIFLQAGIITAGTPKTPDQIASDKIISESGAMADNQGFANKDVLTKTTPLRKIKKVENFQSEIKEREKLIKPIQSIVNWNKIKYPNGCVSKYNASAGVPIISGNALNGISIIYICDSSKSRIDYEEFSFEMPTKVQMQVSLPEENSVPLADGRYVVSTRAGLDGGCKSMVDWISNKKSISVTVVVNSKCDSEKMESTIINVLKSNI